MGYLQVNGFVVPVGPNFMGDGYYNPCVPNTVAVNERVTVKVSVQTTSRGTVQLIVEPSILWLPQSASVHNSVRNRLSVTEGVPAAEISVTGYQTLEQYVNNNSQNVSVTVTVNQQNNQQLVTSTLNELSKEITIETETNREIVEAENLGEKSLVTSKILQNLSQSQRQQVLQQAGESLAESQRLAQLEANARAKAMETWEQAKLRQAQINGTKQQVRQSIRGC